MARRSVLAVLAGSAGALAAGVAWAVVPPVEPPTTDALVLAQQVIAAPAPSVVWGVAPADLVPGSVVDWPATVAPSFLAVRSGELLLSDEDARATERLGAFEAIFVPVGRAGQVATAADVGASMVTITLSEPGTAAPPVGDPFELAAGEYDLELAGDVLDADEFSVIPDSAVGPTLVVVAYGTVTIGDEKRPAGSAVSIDGEVTVLNTSDEPAMVMAATLDGPLVAADESTTTEPPVESAPPTTAMLTTTLDTSPDSDGDGLSDAEEAQLGTDPSNPDTDGDGLSDGDEVNQHGTDPLSTDTDGDTLVDGSELDNGWGCDPTKYDTDGDGYNDHDEGDNCDNPDLPFDVTPATTGP